MYQRWTGIALGLMAWCCTCGHLQAQTLHTELEPGKEWTDHKGEHINAHGGGILLHDGVYYWYGENRPERGFTTEAGVEVYASTDLLNWTDKGVALAVLDEAGHDIERGCIMERPKVVYNAHTRQFVMMFHLELKGRGYEAARVGFAVSDTPCGPFRFVRSLRPNAGRWPEGFTQADIDKARQLREDDYPEWWTPEWRKAIADGLLLARDLKGGQMSRDQTIYIDDDGKAYQITSSEENLTLHINELTNDYMGFTGRYVRVAPGEMNEAPTLLKRNGTYWLITSGCTGWAPNEARMYSSKSIWGPWTRHPSPCRGPKAKTTFDGQGNYIFRQGQRFIFMADRWQPKHLSESPHIWLPITFDAEGVPVIEWKE